MENDKGKKVIIILWVVCVIPLIIGIILWMASIKTTEYSTDEYWVAQGYHHVYERYSGRIVDYIEDNETCEIDRGKIIVKEMGGGYKWGTTLTIIFGPCTIALIVETIRTSDWWDDWKERHNF